MHFKRGSLTGFVFIVGATQCLWAGAAGPAAASDPSGVTLAASSFSGGLPARGEPVRWEAALTPPGVRAGEAGMLVVTAHLAPGWHIYAIAQKAGGPFATSIKLSESPSLAPAGPVLEPTPEKLKTEGFSVPVLELAHSTAFGLPVKVLARGPGPVDASVSVSFEACTDRFCLPPKTMLIHAAGTIASGPVRASYRSSPHSLPPQPAPEVAPSIAASSPPVPGAGIASPETASHNIADQIRKSENGGIWSFLLLAVLSGFLALATPCVFPMIPITVSLFTKQEGGGQKANLGGALTYCLGIVGTFTGLGLLLAGLLGASGIAEFASNPWVNIGIALIFTALALSLMGYLELAIPPSLVNAAHSLSGKGGILGTLLMGLTFTLTSFTCTVPYVGTLLVATAGGNWFWPALGMLAFSSAFALPFFVLALFPGLVTRLPRSGSWLATVKAYMGFIELAAAVKFLSNADLVWQAHLLTRAVFLLIWAIVGIVSGLYLFGKIRLAHSDAARVGPGRKVLGGVMIALGIYAAAAGAGAPLGPLDAYAPPAGYTFKHESSELAVGGRWLRDYDQALALARVTHRPLFVDFTGYTCTNCRWMEANIFPDPAVRRELSRFVLVQLYTDGTGTEYNLNREREQREFKTIALPLYAVVDPAGRAVDAFPGLTHHASEFSAFLEHAREQAR